MNYLAGKSFDSFFQETIIDNNGIPVTDINLGLQNLFVNFNENPDAFYDKSRIYISEIEEGYPDLVAKETFDSQDYWWWFLLTNRLENPMADIKANWTYSIVDSIQIQDFINTVNNTESSNNRIGKLVDLN